MGVGVNSSHNEIFVTDFNSTRTVHSVGVHPQTWINKTVSSRSKRKHRDTKTFLLASWDRAHLRNCGASISRSSCLSCVNKK